MIFFRKVFINSALIATTMICLASSAHSQPVITGPTCTVPGTVYHYRITGSWKASSNMQVCIAGGTFKSKDTAVRACTPQGGAPLGSVLVIWTNPGSASLTLTSSLGNSTLNVTVVSPLQPGTIDSSSLKQSITYDSLPAMITCSLDFGGSCNPVYKDQWQQSLDNLGWIDIPGATSKDLLVKAPLIQSTFFRRRVTETTSGTIGYSNIAYVDVGPAPPTALQSNKVSTDQHWAGLAYNIIGNHSKTN